jgi:antitoxin StbD
VVASITDLKRNPMGTVEAGAGEPVAILNRNEPAFYCVPAERYDALLEYIDDLKLVAEVKERIAANEPMIRARISGDDIEFEDSDA